MRFMIIRKADQDTEAGKMPSAELIEGMGDFTESMIKAGILLAGEGLQPSSNGARITFSSGRPTVIDGPFGEAKELIAGFYLIEVPSREEAIEWAKRWPADIDANPDLEIRQVFEAEDFGEEFSTDQREREERMRAQVEGWS